MRSRDAKNKKMENIREDLRVKKTKKALNESFVALLNEKSFDAITVNELCDRAGIRRATFYKHYTDKFDFLAAYVHTLRDRFDTIVWSSTVEDSDGTDYSEYFVAYAMRLISFISRNTTIIENLMRSNLLPSLITIVAEQNYKDTLERLITGVETGKLKLLTSPETVAGMFVGGVSTVVFAWLRTGREKPADKLAEEVGSYIHRVLDQSFVK